MLRMVYPSSSDVPGMIMAEAEAVELKNILCPHHGI